MTTHSDRSPTPSPNASSSNSARGRARRRWIGLGVIAVIGVPLGIWMFSRNTAGSSTPEATFVVTKGDLRVSVVETGSIRSEKPVKIQSQLEGQNTILKLIPEGTMVKEGDVIAELDVSKLLESKAQQEITSERADASAVQAQKTFDIQESQNESANITRK